MHQGLTSSPDISSCVNLGTLLKFSGFKFVLFPVELIIYTDLMKLSWRLNEGIEGKNT